MDRFHELSAFVAVVEAGGFSAAARRLGDSQSAISKSVNALEKRLGVQLLQRSTRSVRLTEHGRQYYERTQPLLEEMAQADGEIMRTTLEISGPVRVAAAATFGRLHVLPLLPALLARYPGVRLDLQLADGVNDLLAEGIDLAIRVSPERHPDAVVKRITSSPLVCAGSRHYFAQHGVPATPQALAHHNCLIYKDMREWHFTGPQGRFSVPVSGNLSSNTVETILSAVQAGLGIGMFNRASLVEPEQGRGRGTLQDAGIITVLDDFIDDTRDICLVWPRRRFIPARVRAVTEFFAEALAPRL
ncbi:MAG TPA: LysR family transcriptional regulator [Herbaspirillum sp.]|uniref:LysR family transcriptional regulator n=1 Tax=Herbaspirillum sp. TaxID=1890675 RepID=UPI002D5A3FB6|nr:LysR family transcriptional regulator [Herbaspirillum sp.]HZG20976.1 LysR family transcriptional regulator [Herbaspirillum sp.]